MQKEYLFHSNVKMDIFKWLTIQVYLVHNFFYQKNELHLTNMWNKFHWDCPIKIKTKTKTLFFPWEIQLATYHLKAYLEFLNI